MVHIKVQSIKRNTRREKHKINGTDGGTCLKPSFEPIIVARKPVEESIVNNVIKYGVGGINIDECRVGTNGELIDNHKTTGTPFMRNAEDYQQLDRTKSKQGRFPANTILTYDETDFEEVCGGFPNTKSGTISKEYKQGTRFNIAETGKGGNLDFSNCYGDSGSASRYFYCAKASKKDRDEGLEEFEIKGAKELLGRKENSEEASWNGKYSSGNAYAGSGAPKKNIHPTVKPTELMQYLVRLVSPKGATILDPFMGSGSTGKAVMFENKERKANYSFIGIEKEQEYFEIAKARIEWSKNYKEEKENDNQVTIEDLVKCKDCTNNINNKCILYNGKNVNEKDTGCYVGIDKNNKQKLIKYK